MDRNDRSIKQALQIMAALAFVPEEDVKESFKLIVFPEKFLKDTEAMQRELSLGRTVKDFKSKTQQDKERRLLDMV